MQTLHAELKAKLKEILTPEQYTKYQRMRPQRGPRLSGGAPAN
jgi:Spy/CpxP family protein refolding chaperone